VEKTLKIEEEKYIPRFGGDNYPFLLESGRPRSRRKPEFFASPLGWYLSILDIKCRVRYFRCTLKGLSHEMDLAFDDMHGHF
jgi:hypothetical protein